MKSLRLSWDIFRINFLISTFTFGGGYIVIPMMRRYFIEQLNAISEEELIDMAAIAQSSPGAIALNLAVMIGYRLRGIPGAILAGLGTILPPIVILSVISLFYKAFRDNRYVSAILRGMEAGVAATILDLLFDLSVGLAKERNWLVTSLAPLAFVASYILGVNVLLILIAAAIICLIQVLLRPRKEATECSKP